MFHNPILIKIKQVFHNPIPNQNRQVFHNPIYQNQAGVSQSNSGQSDTPSQNTLNLEKEIPQPIGVTTPPTQPEEPPSISLIFTHDLDTIDQNELQEKFKNELQSGNYKRKITDIKIEQVVQIQLFLIHKKNLK